MLFCRNTFEIPAAVWVGLIAAVISMLQLKIANTKIKLDLYDKRFRIYQAVIEFVNSKHDDTELSEATKKIHIAFRESHFLFRKNDHMSVLVLEIQSVKQDILHFESRHSSIAEALYSTDVVKARRERYDANKESLEVLIPVFERVIAKYIEFRSISGFDFVNRKSTWL